MTHNQIAMREAKEKERANRESEKLGRDKNAVEREKIKSTEDIAKKKRTQDYILGALGAGNKAAETGTKIATLMASANDPSWYNLDPQLVSDAGNISYGLALGADNTQESEITVNKNNGSITHGDYVNPVVMRLKWVPTLGSYGDPYAGNALNVCARNIYSYVRYANSGAKNYEANDLMMYILALDSIYSYIAFLMRAYSVALTAKGLNRAYPRAMLQAMRVDPDNIIENLAQLRTYINTLVTRVNAFYVPKGLPIFDRHFWLNFNIFKDVPVKKSREYLFTQEYYFQFTIDSSTSLGYLHAVPLYGATYNDASTLATLSNIKTFGEGLLNALVQDEDINIMSGDILKAYGENGVHMLTQISSDFHIESIYSEEVLMQINNAKVVDINNKSTALDIRQDSSGNVYQGETVPVYGSGYFLNIASNSVRAYSVSNEGLDKLYPTQVKVISYKDDNKPIDNFVATRLTPVIVPNHVQFVDGNTTYYNDRCIITSCGTEVVDGLEIYSSTSTDLASKSSGMFETHYLLQPGASLPNVERKLMRWVLNNNLISKFQWAPRIWMFYPFIPSAGSEHYMFMLYTGDEANFAYVSKETLKAMHEVALLSEYGVPLLGTKVRNR